MAEQTALSANFQARDWEFLIGLTGPTTDVDLQDAITKLRNFYQGEVTKPQGNTVIAIDTVERVPIVLFNRLLTANCGISQTTNTQPYTRIRAAVVAMNNAADNWMSDQLAAIEQTYNTLQGDTRKAGRRSIMMKGYDQN